MADKILGLGVPIGVSDHDGKPIHIGDILEFDQIEFGEHCVFTVVLERGEIIYPGSTSDLTEYCRVIKRFDEHLITSLR